MTRALRLVVLAEGVEDTEQLATLRTLGCDVVQGYAIAPLLEVDAMTRVVREHPSAGDSIVASRDSQRPSAQNALH
jgi:EAL domain-containing protein (putative c-di-GMP-specific phosphodiesterase class I)